MTTLLLPARWYLRPAQALAAGGVALLLAAGSWEVADGSPLLIVEATASDSGSRATAAARALALLRARGDVVSSAMLSDATLADRLIAAGVAPLPRSLPLPTIIEARLRSGVSPDPAVTSLAHVPDLRVDVAGRDTRSAGRRRIGAMLAAAALLALAAGAEAEARLPATRILERLGATRRQRRAHLLLPATISVATGGLAGGLAAAWLSGQWRSDIAGAACVALAMAGWHLAALLVLARSAEARA